MHRTKSLGIAATIVLLIIISPSCFVGPQLHRVYAATRAVSLVGFAATGWNTTNPTITITQGDSLMITTSSGDTAPHRFFVDVDQDNSMTPNCGVDKCATQVPPTSTDTLTGFPAGNYIYYCQFHAAMRGSFIVQPPPDFSVTLNPSTLAVNQGSSQMSSLTVTSVNGFSGTVTFSSPTSPTGITGTLGTSMVSVTPTNSGTTTLTVAVGASTSLGSYTVSVTGSGGGNSHTANLSVNVVKPDFGLMPDQSSLSIIIGSSGNAVITISSQNGFAGKVNLTASVSPSGPSISLNPVTVTLASGGSSSSTLTISSSSGLYPNISPGTYTVVVNATTGSTLFHTASISVTLATPSPSSPAASIPVYVLTIAGVVIAVAISVVAYAVLRKRPRK